MQTENTFVPREIRLYTNGLREVLRLPVSGETQTAQITLDAARWYSACLWGDTDGRQDTLLAVCAPLYINA